MTILGFKYNFAEISFSSLMLRIHEHEVKKCPNTEFFLVRIFRIWTEYGKIWTTKNSLFGHFLRSDGIFQWRIFLWNKKINYTHKKFLLLVQRHIWNNFASVRLIRKFSPHISGKNIYLVVALKKSFLRPATITGAQNENITRVAGATGELKIYLFYIFQ